MAIDLARIEAICFDVDGTLSDTDDLWTARLAAMLAPLRFAFPQRDPRRFARWTIMAAESPGNLVFTALDWLRLDDEVGRLVSFMARRRKHSRSRRFQLIEGVREMLQALHVRYPLAVVSARDETGTLAFLDHFGLRGLFRCVATAQTCEHTKPFPHPVRWAAEQMGVDPAHALMVGDTTVDIRAGRTAGAQTVGVLCGFGSENELRRAGADAVLPSTALLAKLL